MLLTRMVWRRPGTVPASLQGRREGVLIAAGLPLSMCGCDVLLHSISLLNLLLLFAFTRSVFAVSVFFSWALHAVFLQTPPPVLLIHALWVWRHDMRCGKALLPTLSVSSQAQTCVLSWNPQLLELAAVGLLNQSRKTHSQQLSK